MVRKFYKKQREPHKMGENALIQALQRRFSEVNGRIVFWYDPEKSYTAEVKELIPSLPGVRLLKLDEIGSLSVKLLLEIEDPAGKYLVYSNHPEPSPEEDWLYYLKPSQAVFSADRISQIFDELKLDSHQLKPHLKAREAFFRSPARLKSLQGMVSPHETAESLDLKMLSIALKTTQPDFFLCARQLFQLLVEEQKGIEGLPVIWEEIQACHLDGSFWKLCQKYFGIPEALTQPGLLLRRLLVTEFALKLQEPPHSLRALILPKSCTADITAFLSQWRDSATQRKSYDTVSGEIEKEIDINSLLNDLTLEQIREIQTFQAIEKRLISLVKEAISNESKGTWGELISARKMGHWVQNGDSADSDLVPRKSYFYAYRALEVAEEFLKGCGTLESALEPGTLSDCFRSYETTYFKIDRLYRHFCCYADEVEKQPWELLKNLRGKIEECYSCGFIPKIALQWSKMVEAGGERFFQDWRVRDVPNQYDFYERHAAPRLAEAEKRKVFVIISDGFRYEAAEELHRELAGKYRYQSDLSSMLGVLPSYTALGMASLLPHQTLEYTAQGEVHVDGMATGSTEQRRQILAKHEGIAFKADDLLAANKAKGREMVEGHRLIYIYHNRVDASGDSASTEGETFLATGKAIEELASLVRYIIDNLNGTYILITADHGFLFQEKYPEEHEKSKIEEKPQGTILAKKRYLLGTNLPPYEKAWKGSTKETAKAEGNVEFWIPKGVNLFHFVGGARYFHGGLMPQEIVIPVVTVRQIKGKGLALTKIKPVDVQILGNRHIITTSRHRFEFLQTEPVGDRLKPVSLEIFLSDGELPVSDIQKVTFDSESGTMEERKKSVWLSLVSQTFDPKKEFRLVARDLNTGIEQTSVKVTIDRAINEDF